MIRNRIPVEWQILQDDDESNDAWPPQITTSEPRPSRLAWIHTCSYRWGWIAAGVALIAALVSGHLLWRTAKAGLDTIERDLQEAITLEMWTESVQPGASTQARNGMRNESAVARPRQHSPPA